MTIPATDTAIDIAYWFFNRAEKDGIYLETENMQHLLFLAQVHYATSYNMQMLMPSIFVCDHSGFYEPNLKKMFSMGRPFMPPVKFPAQIDSFLENIWMKYGKMSIRELDKLIKNNPAFKENCTAGTINAVDFKSVVDNFIKIGKLNKQNNAFSDNRKKVMLSQNGPVVVSKWQPRKIDIQS